MIIMSVDYGDVRTGVAVCDKNEILASPVSVITETDAEKLAEKIIEFAKERRAESFVVGLPKNLPEDRLIPVCDKVIPDFTSLTIDRLLKELD